MPLALSASAPVNRVRGSLGVRSHVYVGDDCGWHVKPAVLVCLCVKHPSVRDKILRLSANESTGNKLRVLLKHLTAHNESTAGEEESKLRQLVTSPGR